MGVGPALKKGMYGPKGRGCSCCGGGGPKLIVSSTTDHNNKNFAANKPHLVFVTARTCDMAAPWVWPLVTSGALPGNDLPYLVSAFLSWHHQCFDERLTLVHTTDTVHCTVCGTSWGLCRENCTCYHCKSQQGYRASMSYKNVAEHPKHVRILSPNTRRAPRPPLGPGVSRRQVLL
jgi:hypothetical protein